MNEAKNRAAGGIQDAPPPGESATIASILQTIMERQKKSHKSGKTARRALHSKSLGVLNGTFTVRELPPDLQVGLFAKADSHRAVVRFSNGGLGPGAPDILPNVRGVALKVYGVPGAKVLPGEENSTEHDFVMANFPSFFLKTIDQFEMLIKGKILPLLMQDPSLLATTASATTQMVGSLLAVDYFSQVPHRYGDRACKFALLHDSPFGPNPLPNPFDRDYLLHDLDSRAHTSHGRFIMCAQFQLPGESLSDPTQPWHGPQVPLADLEFDLISSPLHESDGEHLAFNPARALQVHEPLGWPGRLRKAVYKADADWRNSMNGV